MKVLKDNNYRRNMLESIQEKINEPNFINHRLIKLLKHAKQLRLKYKILFL